ncbi:hypothetical protein [Rhizobium sp. H4]|uniref:hypothetical protein n=1 Tax=Rhizobium sp. H4 TaxID=2035449 RepID=UPI000D10FEED|nr:hypothetical protein [Rhizobium sp. H4]
MVEKEYFSLLGDKEIFEQCTALSEEIAQGREIGLGDLCARLGIPVETALALASKHASRLHGRPMTIIKIDRRH